MICELENVTPFIIKSGQKISILELFEEEDMLYRIDTDSFSEQLSVEKIKEQSELFVEFVKAKTNAVRNNSGSDGKGQMSENYSKIWEKIQNYNKENGASKFKILPGIEKGEDFNNYIEFDDYINIVKIDKNKKQIIPYIPGSTVKGFIRRMLLLELIKIESSRTNGREINLDTYERYRNYDYNQDFASKSSRDLNELMKCIQVSDFYPAEGVKTKMNTVKRDPQGNKVVLPLVVSGKFYGELNFLCEEKLNKWVDQILSSLKLTGSKKDKENKLFEIIVRNSMIIIEENQKKYKDKYDIGNESGRDLIAMGFGKGLSLSGFASLKGKYNLRLPKIMTMGKGWRNKSKWVEQDYPTTNWAVYFYNGRSLMKNKLGIFKIKNLGDGYIKDIEQLKYILGGND